MKKYLYVARLAFINMMAFRVRFFIGTLTYAIFVSVYYFVWQAVYTHNNSIGGMNLEQMITYICIGWIARTFYHSNIDREIADDFRTGKVSLDMVKPVNFQKMRIFRSIGESVFRVLLLTVPTAIFISIIFPVKGPATYTELILFLLSSFFSLLIFVGMSFILGVLAVYFKRIDGVIYAKNYFVQLLSGLLLPIHFFPEWLQRLLDYLPLKFISYVPLMFYLGKFSHDQVYRQLTLQIAWVAILLLGGKICWKASARQMVIQGG